MRQSLSILATIACVCLLVVAVQARSIHELSKSNSQSAVDGSPNYMLAEHNRGNMAIGVTNHGTFGTGYSTLTLDSFTGLPVNACEYPKGSGKQYLFGSCLWIGAVVGNDTLVSVGADGWQRAQEFHPDEGTAGAIVYRTNLVGQPGYDPAAVSEEDFISVYRDTCTDCRYNDEDYLDDRSHQPIGLEVTEASYAWSHPLADDLILFDLKIKNISDQTLNDVYVGFFVDGDAWRPNDFDGILDDVTGFRQIAQRPAYGGCTASDDSLAIAWIADYDGDLDNPSGSLPDIMGGTWLGVPLAEPTTSYNWWRSSMNPDLDWGPQSRDAYRDLGTGGLGTPEGDRNKYHFLRNGEIDYDQNHTTEVGPGDPNWLPPPTLYQDDIADGTDTKYLLSVGPFDVDPGQTLPLVFTYVGGEGLYTDDGVYREGLAFGEFDNNARWASWIYDNPGFDTDSDGYRGNFVVCHEDTVWTSGDGVPDFHDPTYVPPPPADFLRVEARTSALNLRWNGLACETRVDVFTREVDFEGYNVYVEPTGTKGSAAITASYDVRNYVKYVWDEHTSEWYTWDNPMSFQELWDAYAGGDQAWQPEQHPETHPLVVQTMVGDTVIYFEPFLANASELGVATPIKKVYPDAPKPATTDPNEIPQDSLSIYLTPEGFFKFYEYELLVDNLLPTTEYEVYVTSLDFSCARDGLGVSESPHYHGSVTMFPDTPTDTPEDPENMLPKGFALDQNYPNPFNPATEIAFELPTGSYVTLEVLNIAGQVVETLVDRHLSAGRHAVNWDGGEYASGVYLYRMTAGKVSASKKMMLVK